MKQEQLFLNIGQCKHLQELGLDMSDAGHKWAKQVRTWDDKEPRAYKGGKYRLYKNEPFIIQNFESWDEIPTYTLQEVLNKLPKSIEVSAYDETVTAYLRIDWSEGSIWYECDDYASYNGQLHNILEGAYDMLCWVLENGYLDTTNNR